MNMREATMASSEDIVRKAYAAAERDVSEFISLFADDGYLYDVSSGKKYYGAEVGDLVENFKIPFPDMHRELENVYAIDDVVVVELSLNGTHSGPLETSLGSVPATGKAVKVPCCDVWTVEDGKVRSFHCYTALTILIEQIK